jgi:hypothetical protein
MNSSVIPMWIALSKNSSAPPEPPSQPALPDASLSFTEMLAEFLRSPYAAAQGLARSAPPAVGGGEGKVGGTGAQAAAVPVAPVDAAAEEAGAGAGEDGHAVKRARVE